MQIGDELGPFRFQVSREQLVRYAGASEDYNPIHYDDEVARSFGLPGVIVHGMLNMGLIARYVLDVLPADSCVERYRVRFRQMVQPGEWLTVGARVREREGDRIGIEVELVADGQKPAVTGKMTVRLVAGGH